VCSSEQIIKGLDEICDINIDEDLSIISVTLNKAVEKPSNFHRTSTGITFSYESQVAISPPEFSLNVDQIMTLYREFTNLQKLHSEVGGFHSAALCDAQKPRILVEDLGRHNCIDKLSGLFLFQGQPFIPRVITLSGRISSEMVAKSQALKVPMIISRTSPTSMAIETARKSGITLIGYLKGSQFEIYSHEERVTLDA
jgi:FdhD protein